MTDKDAYEIGKELKNKLSKDWYLRTMGYEPNICVYLQYENSDGITIDLKYYPKIYDRRIKNKCSVSLFDPRTTKQYGKQFYNVSNGDPILLLQKTLLQWTQQQENIIYKTNGCVK